MKREEELTAMTPERAIYFLERFKREEKMLGPNEKLALAYSIALLSTPKREEKLTVSVKIKSLEWERHSGFHGTLFAKSVIGEYAVWSGYYLPPHETEGVRAGSTVDAAKAAAQADYEARIRSALLSNPKPEVEPVEQRDNSELLRALSRMAGNRQSDGTSSLVSWQDREAIINGCHDLLIASRYPPKPEATDDWLSDIVEFLIKHEMLDRDPLHEYDLDDIMGALRDNYAPEAKEGGAHEVSAIDALIVGSYVNDAAHNLLVKHTGMEGGCPRVDWYKLRNEIAAALETAIDDFRAAIRRSK